MAKYNNYKKERYEFIEQMFAKLNAVSPERVIGQYIPLKQQGRHMMGLCPFHHDTKLGSFLVTPDKGIWKCFTCGDEFSGNAVKFVSLYKNINYLDAAFDVALSMGIISREEFDKYSRKQYDGEYVKKLQRRFSDNKRNEPKPVKASADVIHNVYQTMKDVCFLSEEHRKSLLNERKLSEKRIEMDYFTCPTNWKQKDIIVAKIKEKFPSYGDDVLKTVPGFFYDKEKGKVTFSGYKGLCILIRDAKNQIQAVQIRKDNVKKGESRYIWMSSSFAFYRPEEFSGGCGCGSPKDVLWGNRKNSIVCITEGRFKSEILSSHGNTTISIQGVSSWSGIIKTIEDIKKYQNVRFVYVFLDSDILGNHPLFIQSTKMCAAIMEKFPDVSIKYAFWKKDVGKGIDDYINNNGSTKGIAYIKYQNADVVVTKSYARKLKKYGVERFQEFTDEQAEEFREELQIELENIFVK